jgi:hypothetical protein
MQTVSATYTSILSRNHRAEYQVLINGVPYGENQIKRLFVTAGAFGESPALGSCISGEIELEILKPSVTIPRMATVDPYVRITDGTLTSEWLPKGKFYIDTRESTKNDGIDTLTIHGFDSMLKAEQDSPIDGFPMSDVDAVMLMASTIGVSVDADTISAINEGYQVPIPAEYSVREVLGYIAAMYAGCFVMDVNGNLRLVTLNGFPPETNYLINAAGLAITFGGDRILV